MRFHPNRVNDGVGSTSGGPVTDERTEVVLMVREVDDLNAPVASTLQSFGDQVHGDDAGAVMLGDTRCHVANRPEPENDDGSTLWNGGVLDGLPRRGKDVGEVDESVICGTLGHFDVGCFCLGDAQVLRLTSRHLAVELRKPKERSPVPLVLDLGGFALAEELLVAHEAVTTRHLERYDDSVTRLDGGDMLSDFLDDPYRFVAENVSGLHEGRQGLVEVQI